MYMKNCEQIVFCDTMKAHSLCGARNDRVKVLLQKHRYTWSLLVLRTPSLIKICEDLFRDKRRKIGV